MMLTKEQKEEIRSIKHYQEFVGRKNGIMVMYAEFCPQRLYAGSPKALSQLRPRASGRKKGGHKIGIIGTGGGS